MSLRPFWHSTVELFTFSLLVKISITTAVAVTKTTTTTTILILTASFQDNPCKPIPECQNSLDFAAARDDEGNFKINQDKIFKEKQQ